MLEVLSLLPDRITLKMNKYYIKGNVFPPIISFSEQSEHFLSLKCSHMWTCGWATFSAEWNETKQIPWQVMIARGCWGFERYISRLWSKLWSTCCWCLVHIYGVYAHFELNASKTFHKGAELIFGGYGLQALWAKTWRDHLIGFSPQFKYTYGTGIAH